MRKEITVTKEYEGTRTDRFVSKYFPDLPKGKIQKMLRKGDIRLNGKKTTGEVRLSEGDVVRVFTFDEEKKITVREDVGDINVIYEDESLICVMKPAGLVTHPDGNHNDSLSERLIKYLYLGKQQDGVFVSSPLNRLDYNTSGIVLAAKTPSYARVLADLIAKNKVVKEYLALVDGEFTGKRRVVSYATKNESENKMILSDEQEENSLEMVSVFEAVETVGEYTLLKCRLITGKTHQLRAQLEHIGHPIIGDIKYANTASKTKTRQMSVKRQMLHCYKVTIPTDFDTVKVYSAPSEDMLKVIKKLGFRFEKEDIQEI
ncbi:MAG: RluA family pseudouridine synthase [Anaerofustis stercorihominis]|nr:RluA family pseudouridine synthase [Anaerofustis stercorihominis]